MKTKFLILIIYCLPFVFIGCSHSPKTLGSYPGHATYIGEGKRYAEYEQVDGFKGFSRVAYTPVKKRFYSRVSEEMSAVIDEHGMPDAERKPFVSLQGEKVNEWIYSEQELVYQFIAGEKVFEGPLTDSERILMVYGYPNRVIRSTEDATQMVTRSFYYKNIFNNNVKFFLLINDELQQGHEGI